MKEYLKMSNIFEGKIVSEFDCLTDYSGKPFGEVECRYAAHAINSHDKLVAMNKELLAALELMLLIHDEPSGFCGKFGKELDRAIEDQKEKIDTRIAVARNAIAKAKAAS